MHVRVDVCVYEYVQVKRERERDKYRCMLLPSQG